jgi:hypothetical protein
MSTRTREMTAILAAGRGARWGARLALVLLVLSACGVAWLVVRRPEPIVEWAGRRLAVLGRAQTGHQRAERTEFLDAGRRVAVTCPRYDRFCIFGIGEDRSLNLRRDIATRGKPVALAAAQDRLYVLQRPSGDARHLEPAFWQAYDFDGNDLGGSFEVGYDPDDMVVIDEGRVALVLLSGNAEGESNRPDPSLIAVDLSRPESPNLTTSLMLPATLGDPARLVLSQRATHAAILGSGGVVVGLDLVDPLRPSITDGITLAGRDGPLVSVTDSDRIVLPAPEQGDVVALPPARPGGDPRGSWDALVALDAGSGRLLVLSADGRARHGQLELRGPFGVGIVPATGLAVCPVRGLLAAADRSGGLHLLAFEVPNTPQ